MIRLLTALLCAMLLCGCAARAETADELWGQLPVEELETYAAESDLSFVEIAQQLLSGEFADLSQMTERIFQAAREAFVQYWRLMAAILISVFVCELVKAFSAGRPRAAAALELLSRVCTALVLLSVFSGALEEAEAICTALRRFTSAAAPMLVTALMLTGAAGMSAAVPSAALLADQAAVYISTEIGLPVLGCACALAVFSGLGSRFRLGRLFKLCISVVKWMLGCCMTGFLALMSAQGLLLGARDGIAVRTTRFAVDNLMPIIGGELADTVSSVFASAMLVKNAAGIAACAVLIAMAAVPLARLAVIVLMLKLCSAATDLIAVEGISPMLDRVCQAVEALMAVMAAVAALGMILVGAVVLAAGARG